MPRERGRHAYTLEEAEHIRDPNERKVAVNAIKAGLHVEDGKVIESHRPVRDRRGELRKTKTKTDLYIADGESTHYAHVEVTNGRGDGRHKRAQRRVVEAAHETEHYVVLTGRDTERLDDLPDHTKRSFLEWLLGWL